jgi:hypothetical protein
MLRWFSRWPPATRWPLKEQAVQREGFVAAFRSPVMHDAIRKGALYPSSCSGRRSWRIGREASMTVSYDFPGQTAVVTGAAKGMVAAWPNGSATREL